MSRAIVRHEGDLCIYCGLYNVRFKGFSRDFKPRWGKDCEICHKKPYLKHKMEFCALCGFIPVHKCQLDVHHLDGDIYNDTEENLLTVCANCYKLATYIRK
jgi:hypothetical protein